MRCDAAVLVRRYVTSGASQIVTAASITQTTVAYSSRIARSICATRSGAGRTAAAGSAARQESSLHVSAPVTRPCLISTVEGWHTTRTLWQLQGQECSPRHLSLASSCELQEPRLIVSTFTRKVQGGASRNPLIASISSAIAPTAAELPEQPISALSRRGTTGCAVEQPHTKIRLQLAQSPAERRG
jgi:hypothetical protein